MIDKDAADVIAQRHKALLNQLSHQRIPRAEVVMQHRRRHPGLFGDGVQRYAARPSRANSVRAMSINCSRLAVPGFYRAADPGGGSILILLCCHDMAIS